MLFFPIQATHNCICRELLYHGAYICKIIFVILQLSVVVGNPGAVLNDYTVIVQHHFPGGFQ